MRTPEPDLKNIKSGAFDLSFTANKTSLSVIGSTNFGRHLDEFHLFTSHFNYLPNVIHERRINCAKAHAWFVDHYRQDIREYYFRKLYNGKTSHPGFDDCYYFIYDDLLIYFDIYRGRVRFLFKKTPLAEVEKLIAEIRKFRKRGFAKPELSLLVQSTQGMEIKSLEIARARLNIEENYNNDFSAVHETILKRLRKKKDKGIVLLHGKPGTGKTSYIRHLISRVRKHVIFLPPNMANSITNPDLLSILMDHPDSILVIEDAENIVVDRERSSASPVSALLNISDGLLSDCLNIQIICSFNTDLSKVDSALMRKGRLIAKYEFKPLLPDKAQQLSDKLGFSTDINQPMTLTDIYNQEETKFEESRTGIGFIRNAS